MIAGKTSDTSYWIAMATERDETDAAGKAASTKVVQVKKFKVAIIGDSTVGKTCMMYQFCDRSFPKSMVPTVGIDLRTTAVKIGGNPVEVCTCLLRRLIWREREGG